MNFSGSDAGKKILNVAFNQDHGCFSCSMENGIRIYNIEPLRQKTRLDAATVGSVAMCEMLYRTNLMAIVGGGRKQKFADNVVLLWDDFAQKFVAEYTFSSPVVQVKLRKERLYVAQRTHIDVFSCPNNSVKLHAFDTGDNPTGLIAISPFSSSERQILVFPGHYAGSVQIVDLSKINHATSAAPLTINAHTSNLACISLNSQGTMLATASVKGTLIRVFDTLKKTKLIELRRGLDNALFYCINFSHDSEFIISSSDKGTIHIFALKDVHLNTRLAVPTAWFGINNPQYSISKFVVPPECKCQCAFLKTVSMNSVVAICENGSLYKGILTPSGNVHKLSFEDFLKVCDDGKF